jgi:hypothetical protein
VYHGLRGSASYWNVMIMSLEDHQQPSSRPPNGHEERTVSGAAPRRKPRKRRKRRLHGPEFVYKLRRYGLHRLLPNDHRRNHDPQGCRALLHSLSLPAHVRASTECASRSNDSIPPPPSPYLST